MRTFLTTMAAGLILTGVSSTQIVVKEKAMPAQGDKTAAMNVFYKAFWLERGARKLGDAVTHYRKFLAMAPKSEHAPRAARSLVNLLYREDKVEEAQAAEKMFKDVLAQRPARGADARGGRGGERGGRGGMGRGERGGRGGMGRGGDRGGRGGAGAGNTGRDMTAVVQRLEKQIADAKKEGDDEMVAKLQRRLDRVKAGAGRQGGQGGQGAGRGGRGDRGGRGGEGRGGRGNRGGRRGMRPLNEMSKEEATQWLDRMEGFMDRILERMDETRAAEFEKGFKEMKKLVAAGKLEEAEKLRAKVMNFRRRR